MATYLFLARDQFLQKTKPTPWPRTMKLTIQPEMKTATAHCSDLLSQQILTFKKTHLYHLRTVRTITLGPK